MDELHGPGAAPFRVGASAIVETRKPVGLRRYSVLISGPFRQ
jgi:hypothetical protein